MATRFYLASTGSVPITPALSTNWWDNTANSRRLPMNLWPTGTAMTTFNDDNMNATSSQWFGRTQFICPIPLAAQTIAATDTWQTVIRCREELSTDNIFLSGVVRIMSSDGSTERGRDGADDAQEMATSLTAKQNSANTFPSITIQDGDYIVFEVGYDIESTPSDADCAMSFGDDSGTDLADLDTSAFNPWFEVSLDLIFLSTNQLMMTGVGT